MFDPAKILTHFWGLQSKICLVWPFLYFVRYTCHFNFLSYGTPQYLIQPMIGILIWGSRGHPQQELPGRHPYMIKEGYTLYVPVLRCWYLVRLTKMLWAAALKSSFKFHFKHIYTDTSSQLICKQFVIYGFIMSR